MSPPASVAELFERAQQLAGRSLAELAASVGAPVPVDLRRAKGFVGQLVEQLLGATAGSRAEPDFPALGVELKTLPVDWQGRALESTFVCTIDLAALRHVEWERSLVCRKLERVLWVPVLGLRTVPVAERVLGTPLLWSPNADEAAALRHDFTELAGRIGRGDVESITGHLGVVLQVRPKAANGSSRRVALDTDGARYAALPRGFYLRAGFTSAIIARHYVLSRDTAEE